MRADRLTAATRLPWVAGILLALWLGGCASMSTLLGQEPTFTQAELQRQLDRRFPREYARLGGLMSVTLLNPRLVLPDDGSGRLRLDFDVAVGRPGRVPATPDGHLALTSGLRYDRATRALHLDAPRLEQADVPALGGGLNAGARTLFNLWLDDYARDEAVYRLDDSLAGRLASRRITGTRIEAGRVRLELED